MRCYLFARLALVAFTSSWQARWCMCARLLARRCACEAYFSASVVFKIKCTHIRICERWAIYSVYCSSYNFIHLYLTALLASEIHMLAWIIWHARRSHCSSLICRHFLLITETTSSNFSFVARISCCNSFDEEWLNCRTIATFFMFTHKVKQKLYFVRATIYSYAILFKFYICSKIVGAVKPASSTTTPWDFIKQKKPKTPHTKAQNGTTTDKLRTEDVTNTVCCH